MQCCVPEAMEVVSDLVFLEDAMPLGGNRTDVYASFDLEEGGMDGWIDG